MRVLVTRPMDDATAVVAAVSARGHEALLAPLLDIAIIAGDALDLQGVQAIVLTSANGVRAFAQRSNERALPALCVGDATAREARRMGFQSVHSAAGDVTTLAALVARTCDAKAGAVLHPAGSRVAGDLAARLEAAGFSYRREIVYDAVKAKTLPDVARKALAAGTVDGVLLYSPRTGAAFAKLVADAGLTARLSAVRAYCLSPAVAATVQDLPWAAVNVAAHPDQDTLLALLA